MLGQQRAGSTEQGILVTAVARCLRVGWPPVLKLVRLPAVADEKHGSAVRDSDGVKPASVQLCGAGDLGRLPRVFLDLMLVIL